MLKCLTEKRYEKMIMQISATTALLLLSGCTTTFQANQLDKVSEYPATQYKKTIYVDLAYSGRLNGKPWTETTEHNKAYLQNRCIQFFRKSGMFTVVSNKETADFTLSTALRNRLVQTAPVYANAIHHPLQHNGYLPFAGRIKKEFNREEIQVFFQGRRKPVGSACPV